MKSNRSLLHVLLFLLALVVFQFCKPTQSTQVKLSKKIPPELLVSYEKHIKPIMVSKCTPCHFPELGKKKMLDTYESTKESLNDILTRIQLPTEDPEFMPYKSKKPALTPEEIKVFKDWLEQGMSN
jgi:hypothetical protein